MGQAATVPGKAAYSQRWYLVGLDLEDSFKKGPSFTFLRLPTPGAHEAGLLDSVQQLSMKGLL